MREEQARFGPTSELSLIVPLSETVTAARLSSLARSLREQVFESWVALLVPTARLHADAIGAVTELTALDVRFRFATGDPLPPAETLNRALGSAKAEFIVLVDPQYAMRPHTLFLLARAAERNPEVALVYADEDSLDEEGVRSDHYFKPDWNAELLRAQNYFGGVVAFRRSLALDVGGFESQLDEDYAWGLFMRLTEATPPETIHHEPFVLSHRVERLPDAAESARRQLVARALEQRLARIGEEVTVEPVGKLSYRTHRWLKQQPSVSVIVPSTCELALLKPCLDGLLNRTSYTDFEVLLVTSGLVEPNPEQHKYLASISGHDRVRVLRSDEERFNFSRVNNWAAGQANCEFLCFLNDDTEVIEPSWLSAMVACTLQDRVAAVGALLIYPNGRIQHGGVVVGAGEVAAHTYSRERRDICGYHDRAVVAQDVSCVTAACMLFRREVFTDVGGFDEMLPITFNDVDLCLRLRQAAWRVVWTPNAELFHKESASIGRHSGDDRAGYVLSERKLMESRWGRELRSDPHYSPNLSLDTRQLWEPAFPPRIPVPGRREV